VVILCTKFERNRAIHGGVIVISIFYLMTLNFVSRVALGSGIIFTKFELCQVICSRLKSLLLAFIAVDMLCHAVTFCPLTLKVCGSSCV